MAGEILKKRREELGVDINEVSESLKISSEYLLSIENDKFDKLPVAVYTVGYIRCYAKYLNVDAGPVISSFTSHLTSPSPSTIIPVSSSRRRVPAYVYAILLLLVALSAFVFYSSAGKSRAKSPTVEKAVPSGKVANTVPPVPLTLNSAPAKKPDGLNHEANNIAEPAPAVVGKGEHKLEMTSSDAVWIRIKFENGKQEEMVLKSGTSKSWTFEGQAVLRIGNAGGITLKFDGKDLGVPGDSGKVLDLTFPQS